MVRWTPGAAVAIVSHEPTDRSGDGRFRPEPGFQAMRRTAVALVSGLAWLAAITAAGAEVFVYPKPSVGQEQMRRDQHECHTWATRHARFDPSQPVAATGPPRHGPQTRQTATAAAQAQERQRSDIERYERSYAACMAGRGYQIR